MIEMVKLFAGLLLQAGALAFTIIWAVRQLLAEGRQRREAQSIADAQREEADRKALDARKVEIYQRLEIESNRVFEFEARHAKLVPTMKRRLAPVGRFDDLADLVRNEHGERIDPRQIAMIARKYYEMNCNLFEIAARLRKLDLIDADVFGSWVAWYFDTCTEWGFRALWGDLRDNYTPNLREIFDPLCIALIDGWDVAHAQARLTLRTDGDLPDVTEEEVERRRGDFYALIGSPAVFDCPTIAGWLAEVERTRLPHAHPLAYC
ncbi:hypothetical protein [Sphingomonas sp.]|uniref:hypothetical protein n=1 Tax=Sphingomonas sp. TaxID=28214 RepID=UPI002D80BCC9|nr:hypothetical protein [Sphingomonas sp.]